MTAHRVLLIDPDAEARRALHLLIDRRGNAVVATNDLESATKHLAAADCDVVIATLEIARALAAIDDRPPIIALMPVRDPVLVKQALAAGIDDLVLPPFDEPAIDLALRRTRPRTRVEPALASTLVGAGPAMTKLRAMIATIAATKTTVLITGETGTGKELVARAIHDASPRRAKRFVAINRAAIPAPLLDSELFGHARGAFTDAVRDQTGLFSRPITARYFSTRSPSYHSCCKRSCCACCRHSMHGPAIRAACLPTDTSRAR